LIQERDITAVWRKFIFNHPALKPRRQELRSKLTESEKIIWHNIRNNKLGHKFLRQYSIEGYVVDFYCPEKRLAIELDGGYHNAKQSKIYDNYRQKLIEAYNISFVHFTNEEINKGKKLVLAKISALLLD